MNSLPPLSQAQKNELSKLHRIHGQKARIAGLSAAAASFLLIGALIVIGASSLCLTLPGVNVLKDVLLPGTLPGVSAILFSIPFLILAVKWDRKQKTEREHIIRETLTIMAELDIRRLQKDDKVNKRAEFVFNNFLKKEWPRDFKQKFLKDIKKAYEKGCPPENERTPEQKEFLEIFDDAIALIFEKKKK